MSNLTETRQKSSILFGNLDEIHAFHSTVFYPELERCGANPASVGRTFLAHCSDFRALYSSYCQNMPSARQAITDLGQTNWVYANKTKSFARLCNFANKPFPI